MAVPLSASFTIDSTNLDTSSGIKAGGDANKLAPTDQIFLAIGDMVSAAAIVGSWGTGGTGGTVTFATSAEATAGTNTTHSMNPQLTAQAISALQNPLYVVSNGNSYTPSWTAATTNPAIGNGAITGKWHRAGKWMDVDIDISVGSTTTLGSGEWYWSFPSGKKVDTTVMAGVRNGISVVGVIGANRSGNSLQVANAVYHDTTTFKGVSQGGTQYWMNTVPVTWGNGDTFSMRVRVPVSGWA